MEFGGKIVTNLFRLCPRTEFLASSIHIFINYYSLASALFKDNLVCFKIVGDSDSDRYKQNRSLKLSVVTGGRSLERKRSGTAGVDGTTP